MIAPFDPPLQDTLVLATVKDTSHKLIVIVNCFSKNKPPWSVVLILIAYELLVSKSGLAVILKLFPLIVKEALSVLPVPATKVYVNVFAASASVEPKVPTVELAATFSLIAEAESEMSVGVLFKFPIIGLKNSQTLAAL